MCKSFFSLIESSVLFSHSVVSDSLQPHGLQHARLVCPSPTPLASYPHPSEGRQKENHNHRKLIKLITQTTALSNWMKLWAMLCSATQGGQVTVESSDKMWPTGEGNDKPLQYPCLENPMMLPYLFACCLPCLRHHIPQEKPWLVSKILLPVFLSRIFMVSGLTFKSLVNFEFNFVHSMTV